MGFHIVGKTSSLSPSRPRKPPSFLSLKTIFVVIVRLAPKRVFTQGLYSESLINLVILVSLGFCNRMPHIGGLNSAHLFLIVLKAGESKIKVPAIELLVRTFILICGGPPPCCIRTWWRQRAPVSCISSYKVSNPVMRAPPPSSNDLPKAPPPRTIEGEGFNR